MAWRGKHHSVAHGDQCDDHHELARAHSYKSILGNDLLPIYTDRTGRRLWHHAVARETLVQHVVFRLSASARPRNLQRCSGESRNGPLTLQIITSVTSAFCDSPKCFLRTGCWSDAFRLVLAVDEGTHEISHSFWLDQHHSTDHLLNGDWR